MTKSTSRRFACLAATVLAVAAIPAGPASAYVISPCSVTGPKIEWWNPEGNLELVKQANWCYTANSNVQLAFSATWTYFGGNSWPGSHTITVPTRTRTGRRCSPRSRHVTAPEARSSGKRRRSRRPTPVTPATRSRPTSRRVSERPLAAARVAARATGRRLGLVAGGIHRGGGCPQFGDTRGKSFSQLGLAASFKVARISLRVDRSVLDGVLDNLYRPAAAALSAAGLRRTETTVP
jgi:hypothetical protein